jgi:hypothetical protein
VIPNDTHRSLSKVKEAGAWASTTTNLVALSMQGMEELHAFVRELKVENDQLRRCLKKLEARQR